MVVIVSVGRVLVVVSVAIVALSTYISQAQELDNSIVILVELTLRIE